MLELLLAQERTREQDSEKPPRTANKWDPVKFLKSFCITKDTTEGGTSLLQVRETGKEMQRRKVKPHRFLF